MLAAVVVAISVCVVPTVAVVDVVPTAAGLPPGASTQHQLPGFQFESLFRGSLVLVFIPISEVGVSGLAFLRFLYFVGLAIVGLPFGARNW